MALKTTKFVPNDLKTTIIKITSYENKNLQGTMENLYFENKVCFKSLIELLFAVEELLDGMAYPHAATENRSFIQQKKMNIHFGDEEEAVPLATFKLSVIFRQNASWQGKLSWIDGAQEASFRSVFEMVKLIDSVLCPAAEDNLEKIS